MMKSTFELHQMGFFPSPSETEESFFERVEQTLTWAKQRDSQPLSCQGLHYELTLKTKLATEMVEHDGSTCQSLYGCCPSWVPAYAEAKGLPHLTGGMAVQYLDTDSKQVYSWFQLKPIFSQREKWLIYSRQELISHEMCHISRFHLNSHRYEETLAYKTSTSGLRKAIGGALLSPSDQHLLFFSLLAWMSVDLFTILGHELGWLSWALRAIFPILLGLGLIRCRNIHAELKRAQKNLAHLFPAENTLKVLFCLDDEQIYAISKMSSLELESWWQQKQHLQFAHINEIFS
jgi:hypothetical protein